MVLDYTCAAASGMTPSYWKGYITFIKNTDPYELEVTARDSRFHILCGKHEYGNFLCIPNWNIGTELASFNDSLWNLERLATYYPNLSQVDSISIVGALVKLNEYITTSEEAG